MCAMTGTSSYRIVGIDPGLNITGYGCIEIGANTPRIVEAGAIRTDGGGDMAERIAQIHADLTALLEELTPDLVAIEKLYAHYKHPRTSILMAHARGVILLAAQQNGIAVRNLAATEIKKSLTGNGRASKRQMQLAIQSVCGLDEPPEPPDVADALAIALCAANRL
ncbi:MAG: crossover junction endodeoxyribonuclease RuvC [Planctomycetota bacterium]|jgi:crossover junction endodeoxyribonuclease RuvC